MLNASATSCSTRSPVSAEAPVPVIAVRREQKAIGCVGNLARNLASLDAHCLFVVVIGATRDEKDCQQLSRLGAQPGRGSDWVRFEKWMELAVAETKPAASAAASARVAWFVLNSLQKLRFTWYLSRTRC
jgi:hypothetical protein